jgi:NitT/TauT family transport system permease protein
MKVVRTIFWLSVALLALEGLLRVTYTPPYIFATPSDVFRVTLSKFPELFEALKITSAEAAGGFGIAIIFATTFAIVCSFLPAALRQSVSVAVTSVQSIPLLAIAPLLSLWFGYGYMSKAAAAAIVSVFPILTGWMSGFQSVRKDHEELFYNIGGNKLQSVWYLLIPAGLPFFFTGLRVAAPLAILGSVVGEFLGSSAGLGFKIMNNSYYLRTAEMFACIAITAALGIVAVAVISILEARILFWRGRA